MLFASAIGTFFSVVAIRLDVVIFLALIASGRESNVLTNVYDFALYSNALFKVEVSIFGGRTVNFEVHCLLVR